LWGIDPDRQEMARERLNKWAIPHVLDALPSTDADGAIGAVFLVESFDALVERGVPKEKLLAKLRRDRDVWPTWAEIRAGGLLSAHSPDDMELVAEPGRGAGRHPDYALRYSTGERVAVEFKALGLSDEEVAFSQSAKPLLPQLIPPQHGIVTAHIEGSEIRGWPNRETRRRYKADAARRAKNIHSSTREIAAAVIVAQGLEETYVKRLTYRFHDAFAQLPSDHEWCVGFHWSNGAPREMVRDALSQSEPPENLVGVVFTGSVAIPGSMENFITFIPPPFGTDRGREEWTSGNQSVDYAKTIFTRVEESAGVRPTLIRVPSQGRMRDFLFRGGDQRIFPFNVVLVADPRDLPVSRRLASSRP